MHVQFYLLRESQYALAVRLQGKKVIHGTGIHSGENNTAELL